VLYQSATEKKPNSPDKEVKNIYYHLSITDIIFIDTIAVTLDYMPSILFSRQTALWFYFKLTEGIA
jgi:hypothetical protein